MAYASNLDTVNPGTLYTVRDQAYFANDYGDNLTVRVQDGSAYTVGLVGPAGALGAPVTSGGGTITDGKHLVRYRYRDSKTRYVSNPSDLLEQTTGGGSNKLIFTVASSGSQIDTSTDARVDQIILEMTPVSSGEFYVAATLDNTVAATGTIDLSDTKLIVETGVSENWGGPNDEDSWSHNVPPVTAFGCEHKGKHFVGGHYDREYTVTVSSGSTTVTITTSASFSANYEDRYLWVPDDDATYDISSIDTDQQLTIGTAYAGTSGEKDGIITAYEPNMLYWSMTNYMESFDESRFLRRVLEGRGDVLRGMKSYRGDLLLAGRASLSMLKYSVDPTPGDGYEIPIPGFRGIHNWRCMVEANGILYGWDRTGVWSLNGAAITPISHPMRDIVERDIDYDYESTFHAGYDPVTDNLLFFFTTAGDTLPKNAMAYDVARKKWCVYSWPQAITATAIAKKPDGKTVLVLCDENGYSWEYGVDDFGDGVDFDDAIVTCASGSTTTQIEVNETIVSSALVGTYAWLVEDYESRLVISNTAGHILVDSAFTTAPAAGEEVYLGAIESTYELKWDIGGSATNKKKPAYLEISMVPTDGGKGRVYFYADGDSTTAQTFSQRTNETYPEGIRVVNGDSYAEFDTDLPMVAVPVPTDWQRSLKAKIYVLRPEGNWRILNAKFRGREVEDLGE